jgi:predicted RNA methylase
MKDETTMTLQSKVAPYTVVERAAGLYNGVLDIFDYNTSSDVTTPFQLALKQVKELPTRSGNILVPGAGIGTYILALLQEGITPDQITAVELDPAYSRLGYGIFNRFGVNYVSADFLKWQPNMKFDVIIGNPPYQDSSTESKDKKLWTRFVFRSLELLKVGGLLSFLTPNSLVGRTRLPAQMRILLSSQYSLDRVDHTANLFFPNVGVEVCSWCVSNRPYSGVTTVKDSEGVRQVDIREDLPVPSNLKVVEELTEKIRSAIREDNVPELRREYNGVDLTPHSEGEFLNYHAGRNKFFRTNDTCKNTGKLKVAFSYSATYKQWFVTEANVSGSNLYVYVDTVEKGLEIGETLMHPVMSFYIDNWRRTAGYCPAIKNNGALPDIRGLTEEEIRTKFGLTDQEYNYIMSNHKPYKSVPRVV